MRHLFIALGLIVAVTVVFFVLKWVFTPASFGQYGFYRGDNVSEWAAQEGEYTGPVSECRTCHTAKYDKWMVSNHSTINCQTCHGPAKAHVETGAAIRPPVFGEVSEPCLWCHAELISRPDSFSQIDPDLHASTPNCMSCHDPHQPRPAECRACH